MREVVRSILQLSVSPDSADAIPGMVALPPKLVRLVPNGINLGLFKIISVHFGSPSQNVLEMIFKSLRFIPFGATLTHCGAKPNTPDLCGSSESGRQGCQIWDLSGSD